RLVADQPPGQPEVGVAHAPGQAVDEVVVAALGVLQRVKPDLQSLHSLEDPEEERVLRDVRDLKDDVVDEAGGHGSEAGLVRSVVQNGWLMSCPSCSCSSRTRRSTSV